MEAEGVTNGHREDLSLQKISRDVIQLTRQKKEKWKQKQNKFSFWPQGSTRYLPIYSPWNLKRFQMETFSFFFFLLSLYFIGSLGVTIWKFPSIGLRKKLRQLFKIYRGKWEMFSIYSLSSLEYMSQWSQDLHFQNGSIFLKKKRWRHVWFFFFLYTFFFPMGLSTTKKYLPDPFGSSLWSKLNDLSTSPVEDLENQILVW